MGQLHRIPVSSLCKARKDTYKQETLLAAIITLNVSAHVPFPEGNSQLLKAPLWLSSMHQPHLRVLACESQNSLTTNRSHHELLTNTSQCSLLPSSLHRAPLWMQP